MDVERMKNIIAEAFDGAAEEAAKKILEEAPRKKAEEKQHPTGPDFDEWEKNAIVSIATSSEIIFAPEDYYEIQEDGTKKTHFTWDEAMEIEKKTGDKWRLPTMVEWMEIACRFGEKDGNLDSKKLRESLGLGLNGIGYNGVYNHNDVHGVCSQGVYGYYWSRTAYPDYSNRAYYLYLNSFSVEPQSRYCKDYGLSVRLVRRKNHGA